MYRLSTIIATFNLSIILSFICKLMNYLDVSVIVTIIVILNLSVINIYFQENNSVPSRLLITAYYKCHNIF